MIRGGGGPQRKKNISSRVALLPGKFFAGQKVFQENTGQIILARWRSILHYKWNFQSVELTNLYNVAKVCIPVLKGDSMVGHHIGLNASWQKFLPELVCKWQSWDFVTQYMFFLVHWASIFAYFVRLTRLIKCHNMAPKDGLKGKPPHYKPNWENNRHSLWTNQK